MIYGYARVSTDGQSGAAQMQQLLAAGFLKVFREVASGAKTDRAQLRRALGQLESGDVLMVTRLDRFVSLAGVTGTWSGAQQLRHLVRGCDPILFEQERDRLGQGILQRDAT